MAGWPTANGSGGAANGSPTQPTSSWLRQQYDPNAFYTKATNAHDHAERVSFKLRPDVYAQVKKLVSSQQVAEYQTDADFFRDAVVHRLHYIEQNIADTDLREQLMATTEMIEYANHIEGIEREIKNWSEMRQRTRASFEYMTAEEDWEGLQSAVERTVERADTLREPFRSRIMEICKEAEAKLPPEWQVR